MKQLSANGGRSPYHRTDAFRSALSSGQRVVQRMSQRVVMGILMPAIALGLPSRAEAEASLVSGPEGDVADRAAMFDLSMDVQPQMGPGDGQPGAGGRGRPGPVTVTSSQGISSGGIATQDLAAWTSVIPSVASEPIVPEVLAPEWSSPIAVSYPPLPRMVQPAAIAQQPADPPPSSVQLSAPSAEAIDPELGTIRVRPLQEQMASPREVPSELPVITPGAPRPEQRLDLPQDPLNEMGPSEADPGADPELGRIRIRPLPGGTAPANPTIKPPPGTPPGPSRPPLRPPESQPLPRPMTLSIPVFLSGGATLLKTDNTLATVDPLEDSLVRSRLAVTLAPALGSQTFSYASVQSSWVNYQDLDEFSYRDLSLSAGLRQRLGRRMLGDLGWTYQKLVFQDNGDRFLDDHSVFVGLSRQDTLRPPLTLTSFYRFQASFSDPDASSRVRHTLGLSLDYRFKGRWDLGVDTQVNWTQFTQQPREDVYAQAIARVSYQISSTLKLSVFGGLTRGSSSNRRIDFDNTLLGVSLDFNWRL